MIHSTINETECLHLCGNTSKHDHIPTSWNHPCHGKTEHGLSESRSIPTNKGILCEQTHERGDESRGNYRTPKPHATSLMSLKIQTFDKNRSHVALL